MANAKLLLVLHLLHDKSQSSHGKPPRNEETHICHWSDTKNWHPKGQLISKCPYEKPRKQSLSSCKQNIDSLEVVNFQGRNIFFGILSKLIFHKDILKLTDL